jgi:hypothetical protein
MKTTIRLPDDLLRRAKETARDRNTTLTALIEEGLGRVLTTPLQTGSYRLPRASRETGGVQPGIDLTRTSEVLEILDSELPLEKLR